MGGRPVSSEPLRDGVQTQVMSALGLNWGGGGDKNRKSAANSHYHPVSLRVRMGTMNGTLSQHSKGSTYQPGQIGN